MLKAIVCFFSPLAIYSWGSLGHRVVGQLAENNLNKAAKAQVKKLLDPESMADASLWADSVRPNPSRAFQIPWHVAHVPDGMTYRTSKKNKKGDVVWAIGEMIDILKGQKFHSNINKSQALKLLIHFVGDIHLPTHVGRREDNGGGAIGVRFLQGAIPSNLHKLWDEDMIEHFGLSYTALTTYIKRHCSHTSIGPSSPAQWANESMELRPFVYFFDDIHCRPTPKLISHKDILEVYPGLGKNSGPGRIPRITHQYLSRSMPIVLRRLCEGGRRLALLLNTIFSKNP